MSSSRRIGQSALALVGCLVGVPGRAAAQSCQYVQVAATWDHAVALQADGTVWAWGANEAGQLGQGFTSMPSNVPLRVPDLMGVAEVAGGGQSSLARLADGTVMEWGARRTSPSMVRGLGIAVGIAIGGGSSLALLADGTVWTWSLGPPDPVQVPGLEGITRIAAGIGHFLAVRADGSVLAWGSNSNGQIGDGTWTDGGADNDRPVPVPVPGLAGVVDVAAGPASSFAVCADGTAWGWGANAYGQAGIGRWNTAEVRPMRVAALSGVVQASGSAYHSLFRTRDGRVWACGWNDQGELGLGTWSNQSRATPVEVTDLRGATWVSAGGYSSFAVIEDGTLEGWGRNFEGQLGLGFYGDAAPHRTAVFSSCSTPGARLAAGQSHSLVLDAGGGAWSWGNGSRGQLGIGVLSWESLPVSVEGLAGAVDVVAGRSHSLALMGDGSVRAWGTNAAGCLGVDPSVSIAPAPIDVEGLADVVQVAAGDEHSLALLADGTVRAWGWNASGQLGDGTTVDTWVPVPVSGLSDVVAVSAGTEHSLALLSDGTVWAWGRNEPRWVTGGLLGDGTTMSRLTPVEVLGLADVVQVDAGPLHSLALLSDGTVRAWGNNLSGQLGDGSTTSSTTPVMVTGLSNVVQVACGEMFSVALLADGTARAWGEDGADQLADGGFFEDRLEPVVVVGLSDTARIAAGARHCLALGHDGTVHAWGDYQDDRLGNGQGRITRPWRTTCPGAVPNVPPSGTCWPLRVTHAADVVTLDWSDARALLAAEHFHVSKASGHPRAPRVRLNGEVDQGHSLIDLDATEALQFFDVRIANGCEAESDDDEPPGRDGIACP